MSDEVSKVGGVSFILNGEGLLLNKTVNSDFQLVEDFFGSDVSQLELGGSPNDHTSKVNNGTVLYSNTDVVFTDRITIYLARFRKGQCNWEPVIFYDDFNGKDIIMLDEWNFLYSNDNYIVYKIYAKSLPETLPYGGKVPPSTDSEFIRYEKYTNIFSRTRCKFEYNVSTHQVSYEEEPGDDTWVIEQDGRGYTPDDGSIDVESLDESKSQDISSSSSSDGFFENCKFTYIKSTPVGCDTEPPSMADLDFSYCGCLESESIDDIYSSTSSNSSSDPMSDSSVSSLSSDFQPVATQRIPFDGGEESRRMAYIEYDQAIQQDKMFVLIQGYPFTGYAFSLTLNAPEEPFSIVAEDKTDTGITFHTYQIDENETRVAGRLVYTYWTDIEAGTGKKFQYSDEEGAWVRIDIESNTIINYHGSKTLLVPIDEWSNGSPSDEGGSSEEISNDLLTTFLELPEYSSSSSDNMPVSSSSSPLKSSSSNSSSFSSASSSSSSSSRFDAVPPPEDEYIGRLWFGNEFDSRTKAEGIMSLTVYKNGVYALNADLTVDGVDISIKNAYLNDIYSSNIVTKIDYGIGTEADPVTQEQFDSNYTKGVGTISPSRMIFNKVETPENGVNIVFNNKNMYKSSNKSLKKISEIVFDYELDTMTQDRYAPYIDLFIGSTDPIRPCGSTGSFILENIDTGIWYYKSPNQEESRLTLSETGRWSLYRRYLVGINSFSEMTVDISNLYTTNNILDNVPTFTCMGVIDGNTQLLTNDDCYQDLYIAFTSKDHADIADFSTYSNQLHVSLDMAPENYFEYVNSDIERLFTTNGFALWGGYQKSSNGYGEFVMLITYDGLHWKMVAGTADEATYMAHEFASENISPNGFDAVLRYIPSYNVRISHTWYENNVSFMISD